MSSMRPPSCLSSSSGISKLAVSLLATLLCALGSHWYAADYMSDAAVATNSEASTTPAPDTDDSQ